MALPEDLVIPDKPFHLQILDNCKKYGNQVALTDAATEEALSFTDVRSLAYRLAEALREQGVKKGDVLFVMLPNSIRFPVLFLATSLLGAPIAGVNPEFTKYELSNYIEKSGCSFVVTTEEHLFKFEQDIKIFVMDFEEDSSFSSTSSHISLSSLLPTSPDFNLPLPFIYPDDVIITPFSSGTSGKPKCVQLTHDNYNAETAILKYALFNHIPGRRTTLAVLPFYHGSGFWAVMYCLLDGHHTVVMQHFHLMLMLQYIDQYQANVINVVPSLVQAMSKAPPEFNLDTVQTVLCGSAPLGKELSSLFLSRFKNVTNLIQGYGMTEIVVLSHITPLQSESDVEIPLGSCGKLLPGYEAKIVDEEGRELSGVDLKGELLVRSRAVMKGYRNAEEEVVDEHGWLRTGDVVYVNSDGFYFVVDRVKDLIKVHGLQVSPSELEDVLLSHPLVAEAAVIGVPDEAAGQVPRAYLVLKDNASTTDLPDIANYVKSRVAPFKQLKGGIFLREELPKTSSGKILRRELSS